MKKQSQKKYWALSLSLRSANKGLEAAAPCCSRDGFLPKPICSVSDEPCLKDGVGDSVVNRAVYSVSDEIQEFQKPSKEFLQILHRIPKTCRTSISASPSNSSSLTTKAISSYSVWIQRTAHLVEMQFAPPAYGGQW